MNCIKCGEEMDYDVFADAITDDYACDACLTERTPKDVLECVFEVYFDSFENNKGDYFRCEEDYAEFNIALSEAHKLGIDVKAWRRYLNKKIHDKLHPTFPNPYK